MSDKCQNRETTNQEFTSTISACGNQIVFSQSIDSTNRKLEIDANISLASEAALSEIWL